MKKLASIALATALAFSLVACGGAAQTEAPAEDAGGEEEAAEVTTLVGGWTINEEVPDKALSEEQAAIFQQAMGDLLGVDYEPVSVIAEQLVAGRNYAYLCKAKAVTPSAKSEWVVVVIYQDLEGNCSFTCANPIDPADLHIVTADKGAAMGAWTVDGEADAVALPEEAYAAFDKAVEVLATPDTTFTLSPQALIATQVVSGTNYQVLCIGTMNGGTPTVYDMTIYKNLNGEVENVSVDALDLDYYVTPPVTE